MTRFHDRGISEFAFEGEFAVRCPKCQRQAYVINDLHGYRVQSARLSCTSCGYSALWRRGRHQGPSIGIAKRRCRYCGRWLERRYFGSPHKHEARDAGDAGVRRTGHDLRLRRLQRGLARFRSHADGLSSRSRSRRVRRVTASFPNTGSRRWGWSDTARCPESRTARRDAALRSCWAACRGPLRSNRLLARLRGSS